MEENIKIQQQIDDINRKLDIVLEEVMAQKEVRQTASDLVADVSVIGNDMFKAAVTELDGAGVEIDGEAVKILLLKAARNIDTLYEVFGLMESGVDLFHDVSPILRQMGLDGIKLLNEMESKGYIDFLKESMNIMDHIVEHFSVEDVRSLADNIVTILETVKNLTQPEMLEAINNGVVVYKSMNVENIPEYSLFKAARAMNAPEMRKGIGFMITFLKNIAKESEKNSSEKK
ncbi:MAG: DUF1641 domain-containing protein [Bacteroidales bacterium]|nr:DUF1641 domain-containing protein [Bacteroidales bacterium]